MATWTNIEDTFFEPGKPTRSVDGLALRDNPVAIAAGAAGAPKVRTEALQPPSAGSNFIVMRLQEVEAITDSQVYADNGNHNRFDHKRHIGVTVLVGGVIRCRLEQRGQGSGSNSSNVRVLKNGEQVQTWNRLSSEFIERTVDISVSPGDAIIFQQQLSPAGLAGSQVAWRGIRIYSATPDMAVA